MKPGEQAKVYVAGPYTKPEPVTNTATAIRMGDALRAMGFCPFIPHMNMLWEFLYPHPPEYWLEWDNEWLACCDAILRLPGFSKGADAEVALADSLKIPVFYSVQELLDWNRDVWSKQQ